MCQNRVNSTQFTLFKLIEPKDSNCFQFIMAIQKALQKQHDPPRLLLYNRDQRLLPHKSMLLFPALKTPQKGILANHEE